MPIIEAIVKTYKLENQIFTFGSNMIIFCLEDVVPIIGLPVIVEPVTGVDD